MYITNLKHIQQSETTILQLSNYPKLTGQTYLAGGDILVGRTENYMQLWCLPWQPTSTSEIPMVEYDGYCKGWIGTGTLR